MMSNKLVTVCNSFGKNNNYFYGLLDLIISWKKFAIDIIDEMLIFDIGLNDTHINLLNHIDNVKVIKIPECDNSKIDSFNLYKLKPYFIKYFLLNNFDRYFKLNDNILYLDSGICFVDNPKEIFDIINNENIFIVECEDHLVRPWITNETINIMKASDFELDSTISFSGIVGFKCIPINKRFFSECYNFISDNRIYDSLRFTQHDGKLSQTILSVLVNRYKIKKYNHRKFAEHLGIKLREDQILYVHRCGNFSNIREYLRKCDDLL